MTSSHSKVEKNIPVLLNIGGNPEVKVDSMVWAKSKMAWVLDPESDDFSFVELKFAKADAPFDKLRVNKKKITLDCRKVNNSKPPVSWSYKITVDANGTQYDTVEDKPPEGDKPVIRN